MFRLVKYVLLGVAWLFILAVWTAWTRVWVSVALVSLGRWMRTPRRRRTLGLVLKW